MHIALSTPYHVKLMITKKKKNSYFKKTTKLQNIYLLQTLIHIIRV